jgi:hypothetical protein
MVELIHPPASAAEGERAFIERLTGDPFLPAPVKKMKTWDAVANGTKTGDEGVAT